MFLVEGLFILVSQVPCVFTKVPGLSDFQLTSQVLSGEPSGRIRQRHEKLELER